MAYGIFRKVTTLEFFQHHFAKSGHGDGLLMTRQLISTFRQPPLHYLTRSVRRTSGFVLTDNPGVGQFGEESGLSISLSFGDSSLFRPRPAGVVNEDQAPMVLSLPIYLYFLAVGRNGRAISSELGGEIPLELGQAASRSPG